MIFQWNQSPEKVRNFTKYHTDLTGFFSKTFAVFQKCKEIKLGFEDLPTFCYHSQCSVNSSE